MDWLDAKVNKPSTDWTGLSDPCLVLTSNGYALVALYNSNSGYWYDPETEDTFGNVDYYTPLKVPHGWSFNDIYYPEEKNE